MLYVSVLNKILFNFLYTSLGISRNLDVLPFVSQ
jgi:hypothetical protein